MLNKNKALINFISGYITILFLIIIFTILAQTKNDWIGRETGTSVNVLSAISFGISFVVLLFSTTTTTLIFSNSTKAKKVPMVIFLSTLSSSLFIAFSVAVFNLLLSGAINIILLVIMMILISLSILFLIMLIQEFNTKFVMSAISLNRADEWEYNNFMKLLLNKIFVKHESDHTILSVKKNKFKIIFISEEIIERKISLSGDVKSQIVINLEEKIKENEKGAIVYLSNKLPIIEGENDKINVIRNNDLFEFINKNLKEAKNEK